jgi:hypothetical protein
MTEIPWDPVGPAGAVLGACIKSAGLVAATKTMDGVPDRAKLYLFFICVKCEYVGALFS